MSKTIFKYPIFFGLNTIAMPDGCNPICAQSQGEKLMLWAEIDSAEPLTVRHVLVVGTGQEFDPDEFGMDLIYLSTVQQGDFVWHVYA